MALCKPMLTCKYFPVRADKMPFGDILNDLFFNPHDDNLDFPLHGPNTIRFLEALVGGEPTSQSGLFRGTSKEVEEAKAVFMNYYPPIMQALDVILDKGSIESREKALDLLRVAALFHDIGKVIRRANHPPIGSNLLRNFDEEQRQHLVEALVFDKDPVNSDAKHNRFSLIASIVQHHDKFGVVTTGEGALPLFSDILYFTSDESTIDGIRKNFTSVMLVNLVDIAAVTTAPQKIRSRALELARGVGEIRRENKADKEETALLEELVSLCKQEGSCLGIDRVKLSKVLDDWHILVDVVEHEHVQGNRVKLKRHLLDLERNPARAITRILRLLQECGATTGCQALLDGRFMSPTSVESVLVGTLGAHQFQTFCELLATVVKLDYGLNFFKAVLCACARKALDNDYRPSAAHAQGKPWGRLTSKEGKAVADLPADDKARLSGKVTALFVRVLEGLLNRYIGVLGYSTPDPRRFGFQMRDLTLDGKIRDTILELLCVEDHKDAIALTWIADEVTIWSMD